MLFLQPQGMESAIQLIDDRSKNESGEVHDGVRGEWGNNGARKRGMLFVNLIQIIPKMLEGTQIAFPDVIQMVLKIFYAGLLFVIGGAFCQRKPSEDFVLPRLQLLSLQALQFDLWHFDIHNASFSASLIARTIHLDGVATFTIALTVLKRIPAMLYDSVLVKVQLCP